MVDAAPILPTALQSNLSHTLRQFYIDTYHDKFFEEPPAPWFYFFILMELFYHVPVSVWALGGLKRGADLHPTIIHYTYCYIIALGTSLSRLGANEWIS